MTACNRCGSTIAECQQNKCGCPNSGAPKASIEEQAAAHRRL